MRGPRWTAAVSVHRRAVQPVNGSLRNSQRFATDWNRLDAEGRSSFGPPDQLTSSPGYRAPVIAVADAKVVRAVDGIPELAPGEPFSGSLEQADGNHVILKLGPRTFAGYAHLVPGSVRVHRGGRVRRGQLLGLLGNSGNSSGPHLHFQLMNRPSIVDADGLPFVLRRFGLVGEIPSLGALLGADATQTAVPIDRSAAGPRRHVGLVGLPALTLPGR